MATFQERKAWARRFLWLCGLAVAGLAAIPAVAERMVPGVGAGDRRGPVDILAAPWNSLVKVQSELGIRCTGALVGPGRVLTAAHCLTAPRTGKPVQPSSLHVLFGYDRGQYRGHARVRAVISGPSYDPVHPLEGLAVDWAVLLLDGAAPAGVPLLPLNHQVVRGQGMALGGYSQDRAQILMADTACSLLGRTETPRGWLLVHDCDGTRGTSGGPLLVRQGDGWAVAGVNVAVVTGDGKRHNLAVPVERFAFAVR